tara:strand:+ start:995 stop:1216 length:222 start_codon:yes stop_codon:yes gene_type:complete
MPNSTPIFSKKDYLINDEFNKLIVRWYMYMTADENDEELLTQWEEIILQDFRRYALDWLKKNKRKTWWRKDLR